MVLVLLEAFRLKQRLQLCCIASIVSEASSSAVFIKGSTLQTDLISSVVQTATGIGILVGTSTQDINTTQTTTGELLFTEIDPSVTVTYTEITPSVTATYTEITHTGDTWTEIIP